jgi:phosphomevalonate kinase
MTPSICVSAPGKILLTGGYLVLDEDKEGLVIASTTRFYSKISVKVNICNSKGRHNTSFSNFSAIERKQFHTSIFLLML